MPSTKYTIGVLSGAVYVVGNASALLQLVWGDECEVFFRFLNIGDSSFAFANPHMGSFGLQYLQSVLGAYYAKQSGPIEEKRNRTD